MKLKAFNERKNYRLKGIPPKGIITIGIILAGLIGIIIYQSYALYKSSHIHNFVEGEVGTFSTADIKIAVYIDGDKVNEFPQKESGKAFEKLVCTNSEFARFDSVNWMLSVTNIKKPTNCNVYFVDESTTLKFKVLAQETDAATIEAKGDPDFSVVPTIATSGLYATEDEYGTSYYYRGEKEALANNVVFAEHQWKIVRINGDGSIRLIYSGECPNNNCTSSSNSINNGAQYSWMNSSVDAKYAGYMYGGAKEEVSTSKEQAQKNETDSDVKIVIDNWYKNNIRDTKYESYILDNIFCNDRSIESGPGYGNQEPNTYYKAYSRLVTNQANPTPTLKCEQKNDRFTVGDTVLGNGALTYPIGLITADEMQYSGIGVNNYSTNHYLFYDTYWFGYRTFTPYHAALYDTSLFAMSMDSGLVYAYDYSVTPIHVVLNITPGAVIASGNGTEDNPYIISL